MIIITVYKTTVRVKWENIYKASGRVSKCITNSSLFLLKVSFSFERQFQSYSFSYCIEIYLTIHFKKTQSNTNKIRLILLILLIRLPHSSPPPPFTTMIKFWYYYKRPTESSVIASVCWPADLLGSILLGYWGKFYRHVNILWSADKQHSVMITSELARNAQFLAPP